MRKYLFPLLTILPALLLVMGCPQGGTVDLCADAETRCDDNNACTEDTCVAGTGVCENIDTSDCAEGEDCNPETGQCEAIAGG